MKNWILYLFAISILVGCEQDPEVPDYRNNFTGTYSCTKIIRSYIYNQPPTYDTSNVQIVVEKDPDSTYKIIVDGNSIPISENGIYNTYNSSAHTNYNLKFINDSIYLQYGYNYLGGGSNTSIKGIKIN